MAKRKRSGGQWADSGSGSTAGTNNHLSGKGGHASRLPRTWSSLDVLMAAGLLACNPLLAQTTANLPANALPVRAADWAQRGAQGATYSVNGSNALVQTHNPATILHWSSMDVGRTASLRFQMDNATDRVLNKVDSGAILGRTTIDGMLRSNGQVYIYNPNGIVFGQNATVNVNALVASSLKIDDQRFMDGLLSPSVAANLAMDGQLGRLPGAVVVEGSASGSVVQRAALTVAKNGLILLAAPSVQNNGQLSAPDGQVVLAAGTRVFLAAPTSNAMRGLLVEVNSEDLTKLADLAAGFTPQATNTGTVEVQKGNATLVGLSVNQNGLVSATTSVSLNGSIYLKAQDGAQKNSTTEAARATVGGTLVLGQGSQTLVLPDLADTATAQTVPLFKPSQVSLSGSQITLEKNAAVVAPGGDVTVTARAKPAETAATPNASLIHMQEGSSIDVSGTTGVELDMASNVITAELRGGELADNLLLRNSALRGETVRMDVRKAKDGIAVANITGYVSQVGHTVGEFTATGGNVTLTSEGSVKLDQGSAINVSGGWVDYQAGHVNTTKLTLGGKLYDIETAPANLAYDGMVNLADSSTNYEAGYREGKSAGTVQLLTPGLQLGGELKGQVTTGIYQRNLAASDAPKGGQLVLGNADVQGEMALKSPVLLSAANAGNSADGSLHLGVQQLAQQGFSRFTVNTGGTLGMDTALDLPAVTQLSLNAKDDVTLAGNFTSAGGSLGARSVLGTVSVADGVQLDVAGRWQNDVPAARPHLNANGVADGAYVIKGGSISLQANEVAVGNSVRMDVSGGAWMDKSGKVTAGDGGSVALRATPLLDSLDAHLQLGQNVTFLGYGVKKGGSLSLTGRHVRIGGDAASAQAAQAQGDLALTADQLAAGGFASRSVTALGNLTVAQGTQLNPTAQNWLVSETASQQASGRMGSVATPTLLPLASTLLPARTAASLSLRASGLGLPGEQLGVLSVERGASIQMDPGASVTLAADRQVLVDGTVTAHGGQISMLLTPDATSQVDANRSLWLGSHGKLDVSGSTERVLLDANGLASGEVLDGGTVRMGRLNGTTLEAAVGAVVLAQGSVVDVSGTHTSAALRIKSGATTLAPQVLASGAGTIDIRAREGVLLAGELKGQAGSASARGGSLNVVLDREDNPGAQGYSTADRVLTVVSDFSDAQSQALLAQVAQQQPGQAVSALLAQGRVSAAAVQAGGFTRLGLKSQNKLALADGVDLHMGSSLSLDAPELVAATAGAKARLSAAYVSLGNTDARYQDNVAGKVVQASDGTGSLTVSATTVDLTGHSVTQGFGDVKLSASQDIRLNGVAGQEGTEAFHATGSFQTGHQLTLKAAAVYPSTLTEFNVGLTGSDTRLALERAGDVVGPVLSAGGDLTLRADHIVQGGNLMAPQGRLALLANQDLTYASGSLTSVAGSGTVPMGTVTNGTDWTYALGNGQSVTVTVDRKADESLGERNLPTKEIVSSAPVVRQQTGATLDLSGGGQLQAYEFTPGPGGSSDILAASGVFAVVPSYGAAVAPRDLQNGTAGLGVGDQVYLSGIPGLPAGTYTLLPGHYALLPGVFAVQATSGQRDMRAADNTRNLDGSYTVSGYRTSSTDGRGDTRTSGFRIIPSDVVKNSSEFKLYDADTFFSAQSDRLGVADPGLARDAGQVTFTVEQVLSLEGHTLLSASKGKKGKANVSAPRIEVVAQPGTDTGNHVSVSADQLVALNADSLLLGGTRTVGNEGTVLNVGAEVVRVNNNAAHALKGSEIILAARNAVEVSAQSSVVASGTVDHTVQPLLVQGATASDGDGALLRVSAGAAATVVRNNVQGQSGRLDVAAGADVRASGSTWLDATQAMRLNAPLKLAKGSALGVSAPSISLGNTAVTPGVLGFDATALSGFSNLTDLQLSSYGQLDVYGSVTLGSSGLNLLGLSAKSVVGHGGNLDVAAKTVALQGAASGTAATAAAGTGHMTVKANKVTLGDGTLQVQGFADLNLVAATDVVATGTHGVVQVDGALNVNASRITTTDGAIQRLAATGDVVLQPGTGTASAQVAGLGGQLRIEGDHVQVDTTLSANAGQIQVVGQRGVTIGSGKLDAKGVSMAFGSGVAHAPAGKIVIDGGTGNVVVGANAVLDVSATGADAGSLTVLAHGSDTSSFELQGQIRASATAVGTGGTTASPAQGQLVLDVSRMQGGDAFDAINARFNEAGLTASRQIRVRQGDVALGASGVIRAQNIQLSTDNGQLRVAGTLDASGAKGGRIELYAAQADDADNGGALVLASGAHLLAKATTVATSAAGSTGDGGRVVLGVASTDGSEPSSTSGGASLRVQAGARIDVSGAGSGQGGTVLFRAPRVESGGDVAVAELGASITGSRSTTLEGVKVYTARTISEQPDSDTNLDAGLTGRMAVDAGSFMRTASSVQNRLGRTDIQVNAGVEVRSDGDLTVSVNEQAFAQQDRGWNLNTWRFGGQAGTLSLRAGGNLDIRGSISDGFVRGTSQSAMPNWAQDTSAQSWSYRLVGGADFAAANPLATVASASAGDVSVSFARNPTDEDAAVALVRTGTGQIDVAAGRDVVLGRVTLPDADGDTTLDQHFGAAIYTAGRAAELPADFTAPVNNSNGLYGIRSSTAAAFGTEGGAIRLAAQRDVVGAPIPQLVNNWLFRQGRSVVDSNGNLVFETIRNGSTTRTLNTAWWARTDYLGSGVATLGGGDLEVTAASGSVRDLNASVATNAYLPGSAVNADRLTEQGGGDLTVNAGKDVLGGQFYVQKGQATVHADGSIGAGSLKVFDVMAPVQLDGEGNEVAVYTAMSPVFALGDARLDVSAGKNLAVEAIYNPTMARQSVSNVDGGVNPDSAFLANVNDSTNTYRSQYAQYSGFSTYGEQSAVRMTAVGGDLQLTNNGLLLANTSTSMPSYDDSGQKMGAAYVLAPSTVQAVAMGGSVSLGQGMGLAPAANGQLELLAKESVNLPSVGSLYTGVVMLDSDPAAISSPVAPTVMRTENWEVLRGLRNNTLAAHVSGQLHANDSTPVRVIALNGDVAVTEPVSSDQSLLQTVLTLPKRAEIIAGRDVRNLGFAIQHNSDSDQTLVQAGRDIIDSTDPDKENPVKHVVTGAGLLSMVAGRDLDLGNSKGVVTRGNLDNAYLPEGGASVMAIAGSDMPEAYKTATAAEILAGNKKLFADLVTASKKSTLDEFDALIAKAFPASKVQAGDIKVYGSQFKTEQGGSLDLFTPGGSVAAGLVSIPFYLQSKSPAENGIFTVRGGDIRSLVGQNFVVNQGRVFSLGGGDITLISQNGNIDAGRGTKTASSAPPPLLTTDASGNTKIDISGSISGSGIATLRTSDTQEPSNVVAVAPRGIFDAGDAGVRSTGTVVINASVVLNAGNISAASGVSNAVSVDTGGAASTAPASSASTNNQELGKQALAATSDQLSLSVDVIGFGEVSDDEEDGDDEEKKKKRQKRSKAP